MPIGTDLATLAPTFTLTSGSCDQTSGSPPSPTFFAANPVHYVVTAGAIVNDYSVTVSESALSFTGLIVWLKADAVNAADTGQVDGSGKVVQWNDSSGTNHHATNATTGDRPTYITSSLNGLPVIRFTQDNDDNGDRLFLGDLGSQFPSAGSMFAVVTPTDGRYNVFDIRANDSRWMANTWNEAVPGAFRDGRAGISAFSSWPQSGAHIIAMESNSSAYRFVIDGTQIGSVGGNYHSGSGQNWVIANRPGGGQALNGDIAEFILFNRILTIQEAAAVGVYLEQKYGLNTAYQNPDYDTWAASYLPAVVSDPAADLDGDGLTNREEYAFGLNPTSGSSVSPITQQLDKGTGIFKYTRRATPLTTGLSYIYEWSTTLVGTWATFTPVTNPPASNSETPAEEITVQVPAALLTDPTLFVRVRAE